MSKLSRKISKLLTPRNNWDLLSTSFSDLSVFYAAGKSAVFYSRGR